MVAPGWYPDPSGLHEHRYWDGARWTGLGQEDNSPRLRDFSGAQPGIEPRPLAVGLLEPRLTTRPTQFERRDFTDENPVVGADGLPVSREAAQPQPPGRRPLGPTVTRLWLVVMTAVGAAVPGAVAFVVGADPIYAAAGAVAPAVLAVLGGLLWWAESRSRGLRAARATQIAAPANEYQEWLLGTVHAMAAAMKMPPPAVAIVDSDRIDVIAVGPSRRRSLLLVTVGALQRLHEYEIRALLAQGIGSVATGDAATMSLAQGLLNTLVAAPARLVAAPLILPLWPIRRSVLHLFADLFRLAFAIPLSLVSCAAGRLRDRRSDATAADLIGTESLVSALTEVRDDDVGAETSEWLNGLALRAPLSSGPVARRLAPHTDVSLRIAALE